MVNKNIKLQGTYKDQIENLNEKREELLDRRNVELFFSFDIVNSTAYKMLNFTGWSQVIMNVFKEIEKRVIKALPSAEMWRILGDEVVFIVPIKEETDFYIYTDSIFEILNSMVTQLKKGFLFDALMFEIKEKEVMKVQNIISLKAAAWIAIIGEHLNKLELFDNILERYRLQEGYGVFEFLGNDIDAGFRIKEKTHNRRLSISYELAYLLSKKKDYLNNLHIITYKRLKGIWQGRLYPIIWYHDPKYVEGVSFEESFYYDEIENSELVKEYFTNKEKPILEKLMYTDVYKALNKILADQCLESKFIKIQKIIEDSDRDISHLLEPKFLLRLHCVAVCYDKKNKRILIMKRLSNKEKFPGLWEFGCAKGTLGRTLAEQTVIEYKADFNINIRIDCNEEREDVQPIPLAMYEIETEHGKDKGIITMAQIVGDYSINSFSGKKHSEVRWINENEIENFNEPAVKDFKDTLKLVFKKMNEESNDE